MQKQARKTDLTNHVILGIIHLLIPIIIADNACAGVNLSNTRVVYPSDAKHVDLQMTNIESAPALIHAWIDDGDPEARPDSAVSPFLLYPPVTLVDKNRPQTLRLIYSTDNKLPLDRESLYWLNILEIPPKPKSAEASSYLQIPVRSRIKVFFRPKELLGDPFTAANKIKWSFSDSNLRNTLIISNTSPYYISLINFSTRGVGSVDLAPNNATVPPYGSANIKINMKSQGIQLPLNIKYQYIDDFGAPRDLEFTVGEP